jgi:hypothetical protein
MSKSYNPFDWYWLDQDAGEVYSSARQARIAIDDESYKAFIADGTIPTRHPGDADLADVLTAYKLPLYAEDPLLEAKREARDRAIALFHAKQEAGVSYNGAVIQIRDEDLPRIEGAALKALMAKLGAGAFWPADSAWRMADNSSLAIPTAAQMIELAIIAAGAYAALRRRLWAIKDALAAAATVEAVAAIDLEKGWPA